MTTESFDASTSSSEYYDVTKSPSAKFSSVFFARVTKTFPTISIFSDKAKGIYNTVKEFNPVLKNGLETAENKLDEKVHTYHDVLVKVDSFGARQFDKVEELVQHPLENLKSVNKDQVISCVNNAISEKIVTPTSTIISQRIVSPASVMISERINQALTITERTVDSFVDHEGTAKPEDLKAATRVRNLTTRVSKHIKNRVINNLQNATIRLRPQHKVEELKAHTVDLIKYFNENIATQSKNLVSTIQKKSSEKKEVVIETSRKALASVKSKATDVKRQVTTRVSRDVSAISNLVFENLTTLRISEHLSPYLLYASSIILNLKTAAPSPSEVQNKAKAVLSAVEEKFHHIEFKINNYSDGSSAFEIFVPLPSYSQIRLLLSQQTLKLAVERMLELIAKAQNLSTKRTTVVSVEPVDE